MCVQNGFQYDHSSLLYACGCPIHAFPRRAHHCKAGLDRDKWSLIECEELVKELGFTEGKFKMWWRTRQDVKHNIFKPILNDTETMVLASYAI